MAELMAEFLPPGVFNVVCGDRDTGRAIVSHPVPAMVSITGSVTSKEVAAAAAADLKRVHLELGGKAPVVVYDDADVATAAEAIAAAGYFNAGQDCTAATRVLAGPGIHDDFVDALQSRRGAETVTSSIADRRDVNPAPGSAAERLLRAPRRRRPRRPSRGLACLKLADLLEIGPKRSGGCGGPIPIRSWRSEELARSGGREPIGRTERTRTA